MMDTNTKKLFKAAKQNMFQEVVRLIEKEGIPTTAVNRKGRTVGHFAVHNGNFDMLKYVVERDSSILRIQDDDWYNIFHLAVERGALNMVKYLVEKHNEDIFQKFLPDSGETGTALHRAAKFGHTDMVKYFIGQRNVDVNGCVGAQKQPPLFLAVKYKHPDVVNYFIDERNANLTLVDCNGENILYPAVQNNDLNLVKHVLDEKKSQIDLDCKNKYDQTIVGELLTCDYYGSSNDDWFEMLKYLVEQKNVNIVNERVPAPTTERNERMIKYLAEHGTNIGGVNSFNQNLLHDVQSEDFCEYLTKHGLDVNQKDYRGNTPLHYAIYANRYKVSVCLIEGGADWKEKLDLVMEREETDLMKYLIKKKKIDVNEPGKLGRTKLHRAAYSNQYRMCQLLVNFGANVNQQDKLGNTALHDAADSSRIYGNLQIFRFLLNRGANPDIKNNDSLVPAEIIDDEDVRNFLKQYTPSKRSRRGALDYYAAAAVPHNQIAVGSYGNGQQKIAEGDLNRDGYYWGRETSMSFDNVSPHLQNWFLFTQLLFRDAMNFVRSRKEEQGSVVLSVPRASLLGRMDPIAEHATGALPDFRMQK